MQIVNSKYRRHINGREEYSEEEKKTIEENKLKAQEKIAKREVFTEYKDLVQEEKCLESEERRIKFIDEIIDITKGEVNKNEIEKIVDKFINENGILLELPYIYTESDPEIYEEEIIEIDDEFLYEGYRGDETTRKISETTIIHGDLKPGKKDKYIESHSGNIVHDEEKRKISDFSMNKIQIAMVNSNYHDDEYGNNENETSIHIYVPKEKEYNIVSYKDAYIEKKHLELEQNITEATNGKLNNKEIKNIASNIEIINEDGEIIELPQISVKTDPRAFESSVRNKEDVFSYEGMHGHEVSKSLSKTTMIYGDLEPGKDYKYVKSYSGNIENEEEKSTDTDFSMNKVQIALVNWSKFDNCINNIDEKGKIIQIYIPEEREYDIVSYKEMIEIEELKNLMKVDESLDRQIQEVEKQIEEKTRTSDKQL